MKKLIAIASILFYASLSNAATVRLVFEWDANKEPDLAGYRLYTSNVSGQYVKGQQILQVGLVTTCDDTIDILPGEAVYYVLTAFNAKGNESGFSNEVTFFLPADPGGGAPTPPVFRLKSWADASSK